MIVSHRHRLIFLKTRKTAGTSVEIALSRICGPEDTITRLTDEDEELRASLGGLGPQNFESPPLPEKAFNHMPARGVRLVVGPQTWRDYFRFAIERNPWDLVVSQYYWRYRHEEAPPFDLVVINPFLVIGPSVGPGLNTSNQLFVDLLAGTYPGVMSLTFAFVDVRDVADAHVRAMETPSARGRYICAGAAVPMRELVQIVSDAGWGPGHKLPKLGMDCAAGDFAVKLSSYLQPKGVGTYLRTHVGRVPRYDTSKIERELGISFRPPAESIRAALDDMARWGHVSEKQA